jgi:hypothetical protein
VDLAGLSREELTAFTLNTYNALVIHGLVVQGTKQMGSLLGRARFFTQVMTVGGWTRMGEGAGKVDVGA